MHDKAKNETSPCFLRTSVASIHSGHWEPKTQSLLPAELSSSKVPCQYFIFSWSPLDNVNHKIAIILLFCSLFGLFRLHVRCEFLFPTSNSFHISVNYTKLMCLVIEYIEPGIKFVLKISLLHVESLNNNN